VAEEQLRAADSGIFQSGVGLSLQLSSFRRVTSISRQIMCLILRVRVKLLAYDTARSAPLFGNQTAVDPCRINLL
jgi:hypothetical protein